MARPASAPPELPGYTFVRLLGSGGFSDVFLYDQHLPKRRVAVKVLLADELSSGNRAAFVAEANLMAQLSAHPYIVTIHQADVASGDRPYFVMEYCSGPSLAERYKRGTFAVADALRTGIRVASAVATAHSAGILHRDIKPANVLGNDYGWPALTDFGISTAVDDEPEALLSETVTTATLHDTGTDSQSVGMSVPWSPPEMFEDDPRPDVRSDVFSLAATIYTILAGQSPFEIPNRSNGTLDLIGRIERGAVTPMTRTDVPRSLLAVLQKGMATKRDDRFPTAIDLARALQRVELELGYAPTTIEVPNLLIEAPQRQAVPDDADETRARSVSTIDAQPGVGAPTGAQARPAAGSSAPTGWLAPPSAPVPGEAPDETVVRRRDAPSRAVGPPADAGAPHTAPHNAAGAAFAPGSFASQPLEGAAHAQGLTDPTPSPRASRANRIVLWVASALAVLVAVGVVTAIATGSFTAGDPDPGPAPTAGGGGSAVVASVPSPDLVSATQDGGDLVFVVENPDAEEGDSFVWKLAGRAANEPFRPVPSDTIVVGDYVAGTTLCIEVSVRRDGKISAVPLEACFPS